MEEMPTLSNLEAFVRSKLDGRGLADHALEWIVADLMPRVREASMRTEFEPFEGVTPEIRILIWRVTM